ncbi:MAG: M20/M25/M40 family metallo-hydrolase [Clostridia bacterium]|nr:M20/M25/M40 family metallo-hydrolase [Clostridia bacterium]
MTYESLLKALTGVMTISGNENNALTVVKELVGTYFDEITADNAHNILLTRRCGREFAPKIMLDAHLDEIGMIVTGVTEDGLLSVSGVGGLDKQLLPGADMWICGREKRIYGVVAAHPADLLRLSDEEKKPTYENLRIETGYTKEELTELGIGVGTFVGYNSKITSLANRRMAGKGMDDKSCCAGLLFAVCETDREKLAADITVVLSAREEIGGNGANCAAHAIKPHIAIVTDVNFAATPGMEKKYSGKMGKGPMVSLSAVTDRRLTEKILHIAKEAEISVTTVVEATNTGTNANALVFCEAGIPAAVVSIPLANMHAYNETLSLDDGESFVKLIQAIITDPDLCTDFIVTPYEGGLRG